MAFTLLCTVDPAAVLVWEVIGVTQPLEGSISRGETVRSFTYPNVLGQSTLNVNDPSRMDVNNQTCFIYRADYPTGNLARSDPFCVDVAGMLILDLSVIVYHSTIMVVVGSKKMPVLTRPQSAHSHSITLNRLTGKSMLFCTECIL